MTQSLSQILHKVFRIIQDDSIPCNDLTHTLWRVCLSLTDEDVIEYALDEHLVMKHILKLQEQFGSELRTTMQSVTRVLMAK